MNVLNIVLFVCGLGTGIYLTLLGMGCKFPPKKWQGNEEITWIGRIIVFLSLLTLPTFFGASFTQVREWLESIWTSGGGAGTG